MNSPIPTTEVALRLAAAALAGALVGLERESHGRPAGLRTTILACVASAIAMVVSEHFFLTTPAGNWRPDPARLGAGVLTGIGFLGAGTILRHNNLVDRSHHGRQPVVCDGARDSLRQRSLPVGALGTGAALLTLLLLPLFEKHIPNDWYSTLTVTMELDALSEEEFQRRLEGLGLEVKRMGADYNMAAGRKTLTCDLKLKKRIVAELSGRTIAELRRQPGVIQIQWS